MVLGSVGAKLNLGVLAFTLGVALATGVLSGVFPALGARGEDVAAVLREARGGETRKSVRVRSALIGVQLALAVVLLVGAVLFVRTLRNRLRFDLGFPVGGLAMITVDPSMNRYAPERVNALIDELVAQASSLPGVTSASAGVVVPVEGNSMGTFVSIDGYEPSPDEELRAEYNAVAPGFLRTLGLPLIAGREIEASDVAAHARVIVIDETMARRWWRDRDPLGAVVRFRTPGGTEPFTVIGVMKRSAWGGIEVGTDPFMLIPVSSMPGRVPGFDGATTVIARTEGDASALVGSLRAALAKVDPGVAVLRARTMSGELNARLAGQRAGAALITTFGALALVLAILGIYGVVSYIAANRRRELSVRVALGARSAQIVRVVAGGLLMPCVIGLAAGLAAARMLSRFAGSFLFGVTPSDTATYVLIAIILALAAGTAAVLPAARATRIDPAVVMRQD
jgi:predicted permease